MEVGLAWLKDGVVDTPLHGLRVPYKPLKVSLGSAPVWMDCGLVAVGSLSGYPRGSLGSSPLSADRPRGVPSLLLALRSV